MTCGSFDRRGSTAGSEAALDGALTAQRKPVDKTESRVD